MPVDIRKAETRSSRFLSPIHSPENVFYKIIPSHLFVFNIHPSDSSCDRHCFKYVRLIDPSPFPHPLGLRLPRGGVRDGLVLFRGIVIGIVSLVGGCIVVDCVSRAGKTVLIGSNWISRSSVVFSTVRSSSMVGQVRLAGQEAMITRKKNTCFIVDV